LPFLFYWQRWLPAVQPVDILVLKYGSLLVSDECAEPYSAYLMIALPEGRQGKNKKVLASAPPEVAASGKSHRFNP
jgi:hypothetical protein